MKKITLLLLAAAFLQLAGCGPSKAEMEAHQKAGEVYDRASGTFTKVSMDDSIHMAITSGESAILISQSIQILKPNGQGGGSLRLITVNDHQYLQWFSGDGVGGMCHDENCTNPKHTLP